MASAKRTAEYRKIQDNYAKISSTLTELVSPGDLASKLFEARLVGKQLKQFANKEIRDDGERINRLLGAVHNQIELNSANFYKFIKILEEYVELEELLKLLKCKWIFEMYFHQDPGFPGLSTFPIIINHPRLSFY